MAEFRFSQPENLGVFVCDNVRLRGQPILHVSHDEEGDWQFLCGGQHADGNSEDQGGLACLRDVVEGDQSLNELADLCPSSEAERAKPGSPWTIHDRTEDNLRENVRLHGCHVMNIAEDDDGAGFSYSIGLTKNYQQPELICFGLDHDVMHSMINELRDRMAAGARFEPGQRVSGLLERYDCELRRMSKAQYRDFLGYALWFYEGDGFDALQIVWPDREHRFPGDAGYSAPASQQPQTW